MGRKIGDRNTIQSTFICSICQQPGHRAEMCPNGQVDWIAKLGNRAFRLRPNQFWTQDSVNPKNRRVNITNLEMIEISVKKYLEQKNNNKEISLQEIWMLAAQTYKM